MIASTPKRGFPGAAGFRDAVARVPAPVWALLAYACLSLLLYGRQVIGDPAHVVEGFGQRPAFYGRDQSNFVWFLAWGARALTHLQNPFLADVVFVPHGYNLTWATSILGPAFVLAPATLLLGPVVSFNLLTLAAPAAAAWTAFLLCRHVTGRSGPAFAGGLLFGFGSYESAEMVNHVHLALVALLPLAVLIVLRRHAGLTSQRRFIAELAAVLALQLWTSTEVFASMVVFGTAALVLAGLLGGRERRRQTRRVALEALAALAIAVALASPYLYHALRYPNPLSKLTVASRGLDLANLVVPTVVTLIHGGPAAHAAARFPGNVSEQTGYFGVPLLVLLVFVAIRFRRRFEARLLVAVAALAAIASLGSRAVVDGHHTAYTLPWDLAGRLPLLRYAIPSRLIVYAWLAAAILVAYWLAESTRPLARWLVAAFVLVSVAPNTTGVPWGTHVDNPPLLSSPALARYVPRGSTVLALPLWITGDSMYWQVEADFRFRLAGGYVSLTPPRDYGRDSPLIRELEGMHFHGNDARALCQFIRLTRSSTILLRDRAPGSWDQLLGPLGVTPAHVGGFSIYELGSSRGASEATRRCAALAH